MSNKQSESASKSSKTSAGSSKSGSSASLGSSSAAGASSSKSSNASGSCSKAGSSANSGMSSSGGSSFTSRSNSKASSKSHGSSSASSSKGPSSSAASNSKANKNSSVGSQSSSKSASKGSSSSHPSTANTGQALIATACTMNVPTSKVDVNDFAKVEGAKKVKSLADIEGEGFQIQDKIVDNGVDEFFNAIAKEHKCLCKVTALKKCSGRYRENLLSVFGGLRVLRYIGGADSTGKIKSAAFIKVHDIFLLDKSVYTFMELVPGKSLFVRMTDKEGTTSEMHRKWAIQLLQAVQKLQEVGVAHRQLTMHQILFNKADQVKIAGWGKATIYWDPANGGAALLQNPEPRVRICSHLPPDCFRGPYDPSKVDIWSIGVLMVAMATGRLPFNVAAGIKISAQWRQFVTVHPMNRALRSACNQVFWIDPKRRITVEDLLKHAYFTSAADKIEQKGVKTSADPKHQPELFSGADPSVSMSSIGGGTSGNSTGAVSSASSAPICSKSASADGGSSKSRSSSATLSSSSGHGRSSSAASSSSTGGSSSAAEEGSDISTGNEGGSVGDSKPSNRESQDALISAPEESAENGKPLSVASSSFTPAALQASGSKHSGKSKK